MYLLLAFKLSLAAPKSLCVLCEIARIVKCTGGTLLVGSTSLFTKHSGRVLQKFAIVLTVSSN